MMNVNAISHHRTSLTQESTQKTLLFVVGAACLLVSPVTLATVNCVPGAANPPIIDTIRLAPMNISAGQDIPVGTVIYRGSWSSKAPSGEHMVCSGSSRNQEPFSFAMNSIVENVSRPLINTSTMYGNSVYDSGIPGIGVVFTDGTSPITHTGMTEERRLLNMTASNNVPLGVQRTSGATRFIELIKTGPISPGSYTLSASTLPKIRLTYNNISGYTGATGLPISSNILQFDASITVNTQSCITPDVNVNLGTHDISQAFSGVGSKTGWVRAGLELTNCPTFYGFYNQSNTAQIFIGNAGGTGSIPASIANTISAQFTPNTSVVDGPNGVMGLDSTATPAATGVGIQLGWGEGNPVPFNLSQAQAMVLPKDGRSTIPVPLYARYIQTNTAITPGKANGKVTFLINYN